MKTNKYEDVSFDVYGIDAKGCGECRLSYEVHPTLTIGGGMPGQGYPCILIVSRKEEEHE